MKSAEAVGRSESFFGKLESFLLIGIVIASCAPAVTPPEKGTRRAYKWRLDTLAFEGATQTLMTSAFGRTRRDVWLVGHCDKSAGAMFHFDGLSWSTTAYHVTQGGSISGAIGLKGIAGLSPGKIVAIGERLHSDPNSPSAFLDSALIIEKNEADWTEVRTAGRGLRTIAVSEMNQVWVGGSDFRLFKFDGIDWNEAALPIPASTGSLNTIYGIGHSNEIGTIVLASTRLYGGVSSQSYFLIEHLGNWTVVDSSISTSRWGSAGIWVSPTNVVYSVGGGLYRLTGRSWTMITSVGDNLFGSADDNLFLTSYTSGVLHFNGIDWGSLVNFDFPNVHMTCGWTDGSEVFLVGHDLSTFPQKTIVFHGR